MRITTIGAVLLLTLTGACASAQPMADVGNVLSQVVARDELPGGVAVVRDDADTNRASAGYSDGDARAACPARAHARAASKTKALGAVPTLELVAEGKVNLEPPVEKYLPGRIRGE